MPLCAQKEKKKCLFECKGGKYLVDGLLLTTLPFIANHWRFFPYLQLLPWAELISNGSVTFSRQRLLPNRQKTSKPSLSNLHGSLVLLITSSFKKTRVDVWSIYWRPHKTNSGGKNALGRYWNDIHRVFIV